MSIGEKMFSTHAMSDGQSDGSAVPFFVACHVGAGYHSHSKESQYMRALQGACRAAAAVLISCSDPFQAVVEAIRVLEVSKYICRGVDFMWHYNPDDVIKTGSTPVALHCTPFL